MDINSGILSDKQTVAFSAKKITFFLFSIVCLLALIDATIITLGTVMEVKNMATWYLNWYFGFNGENNIPAFYSTIILFLASALLYITAVSSDSKRDRGYWYLLSVIFLFLCLDENVQIHELLNNYVRAALPGDLNGLLYWAWVVPYFIFFCLTAAFFLPFVLRLEKGTRKLFFVSGAIFVGGAVGLELFEGYFYKIYGVDHLYNKILYSLEETMEMTGVILFNYALLVRLGRQGKSLSLLPDRKTTTEPDTLQK